MTIAFVAQEWDLGNFEFDMSTLPLTEGDILIAFLVNADPGDVPSPPVGWTELSSSPAVLPDPPSSFFATMWAYVHVLGAGETGIYDFTNADPESLGWAAAFAEYSDLDPDAPTGNNSMNGNGNATPTLTLPAVTATRTGSTALVAAANQLTLQPSVEGFTARPNVTAVPIYLFDKVVNVGSTGDIDVVSANELGNGWDIAFLIILQPAIAAGTRFDCAVIDSQIN